MIARILNACWTFTTRIFGRLFEFLGNLFGYLFQQLFNFLKFLFRPLFILIGIIFYVLYKLGVLAVLLLQVFLAIGKLFFALVKGIFVTLAGFSFTPSSTRSDGQWTSIFTNVVDGLGSYQLDTLAYVLLFLVWFGTGWAAIRTLSSIRNGGE